MTRLQAKSNKQQKLLKQYIIQLYDQKWNIQVLFLNAFQNLKRKK